MGQLASSSSSSSSSGSKKKKKKKIADREAIVCIMCQCSKNMPHISEGFKYFEVLVRGKILQMEYLFEKKFRLILLWQYYACFLLFLSIFLFYI